MGHYVPIEKMRASRRRALEILFAREFNDYIEEIPTADELERTSELLVKAFVEGVNMHRSEIDKEIAKYLRKWTMTRIDKVDATILRMAFYEFLYSPDRLDKNIIINEAIELGKAYGGEKSYKFINAVLDAFCKDRKR